MYIGTIHCAFSYRAPLPSARLATGVHTIVLSIALCRGRGDGLAQAGKPDPRSIVPAPKSTAALAGNQWQLGVWRGTSRAKAPSRQGAKGRERGGRSDCLDRGRFTDHLFLPLRLCDLVTLRERFLALTLPSASRSRVPNPLLPLSLRCPRGNRPAGRAGMKSAGGWTARPTPRWYNSLGGGAGVRFCGDPGGPPPCQSRSQSHESRHAARPEWHRRGVRRGRGPGTHHRQPHAAEDPRLHPQQRRHVSHQADHHRPVTSRSQLCLAGGPRRRPGHAGADPGADRRSRGGAGHQPGLPAGGGRHRRGLSRGLLQHHEPADRGAVGGGMGPGGRPGDGLRHPRRPGRCAPPAACR